MGSVAWPRWRGAGAWLWARTTTTHRSRATSDGVRDSAGRQRMSGWRVCARAGSGGDGARDYANTRGARCVVGRPVLPHAGALSP
eukprot:3859148-Prymnesium_polylepis.1